MYLFLFTKCSVSLKIYNKFVIEIKLKRFIFHYKNRKSWQSNDFITDSCIEGGLSCKLNIPILIYNKRDPLTKTPGINRDEVEKQ